jgi:hypothetical protein
MPRGLVRGTGLLEQAVADDDRRGAGIPTRSRRRIARGDGVARVGVEAHVVEVKVRGDASSVCTLSASGGSPRALRGVHSFGDQLR